MVSARLLLIEPYPDSRDLYRDDLESRGFHVTTTTTLADATVAAQGVDIVVTTLHISGRSDGLAFVRWLRLHEATARLPVVMLSTRTRDHDVAKARAAGCDLFLAKPCLPHDLARSVRWVLAWTRRGRPMLTASTPITRLAPVRAVAGHYLAHPR